MAGRIPQSFIDELLARVDVIDVVHSRVKLKKTGKNYSACCPFHNENTPSFTVSPDKQFYYCFGCGASGTALRFVMEFDGLSFPDAVEKLADQMNMAVPREAASQREVQQEQEHQSLFKRMEAASQFFERQLREHDKRDRAIQYLKGRGLSGKAAKFFGIGYAPPGWDNLQEALGTDKTAVRELVTSGMLIEKDDGRTYDRFRDRIMFPIRDARGRYIAFGGRVLGDEKPKYLNSPETPIFQKNRELYGLYEARKIRQKLTRFVIVEGYMDVVALAEFGIHYAVATLGTATSEHHLRRLFKIVPEVIFCFDGDDAGRTAAARAMETALPVLSDGVQARFLFLPDGEDPDTLVRQEGRDGFEKRLNESLHLPEFLFEQLKQQVDFDTLDGKARLDKMAAPLIGKLPKGTLRSLMEKRLEDMIGTRSAAMAAVNETAPEPEPEIDDGVSMPDIITEPVPPSHAPDTEDPLAPMVHRAISSLVRFPGLAQELSIPETEAETEYERLLFEILKRLHQSPQQESIGLLIQWIGSPYEPELKALADHPESDQIRPVAADVRVVLERMTARKDDRALEELEAKFHRGEKLTPEERSQLHELKKQRKQRNHKRTGIYHRH
ncbi:MULTISPECIES: DNA primase [Thalassolituus]|uniref:DNA primase n=1 Tax=Thalassolituus TaxID=187492 RepID=UPI0007CF9324|nr:MULTISPECIES: DNA primase [Thalassolituus]KZY97938.1 DNA primase [Oleibacter sp. HI0075]MAX85337.1 DNA primase [Oceanospirillaceae bacterium]MEC9409392.1 DNA primase [Pseudomonadota bacterium]HCG78766.1 DNA primase [Oceanospirillales bacterium]|tara:strand:- start:12426 stop:14261 length:1836 start_codon:yes stop_codon:yes gene_type:complete